MKLEDLIPGVSTAKMIGWAVGALGAAALIAFCFFTVKGWHDDAARLPFVTAQRDQAVAKYDALDKSMTKTLGDIAAGIIALQARRAAQDKALDDNSATIDGQVQDFLRRFADALSKDPRCAEPGAVRDGLLRLFPLYKPAQPGAGGGGGQGAGPAGSPGAGAAPASVPGRQRSSAGERRLGMSAPARRAGGVAAAGPAEAAGGADRRAAQGNGPSLPVVPVGLAERGWFARARLAFAAALKLAWQAALETAQDDKGDA